MNETSYIEIFELLDSIKLQLIESEKLDCMNSIYEYDFETTLVETIDVRLEADIKYRFIKK